jgi:hypothetical protein
MPHSIPRPQHRSHARQFVSSLTRSQHNALRFILLRRDGLAELRDALGIEHMRVAPLTEQRTAHALGGTTVELKGMYADLPSCKHAEVTQ